MVVEIDDAILYDFIYWGEISGLFDRDAPGHIGSQSWHRLIFQSTSVQYKSQTTGIQWGYGFQHASAIALGTETVDPEH